MKIKNKISFGVLIFILLVFITLRFSFHPTRILSYDVFGYYLYLPSLVIHHDPGLHDISWVNQVNEQYPASPSLYQISKTSGGNWVIRFYSGMAFLYAPFFLAGHLYALASSYPADGFSPPYQWAIIISGICYTLLGVWLMRKLLLEFFSDKVTAFTLFLLFIGSNLFFFSTIGNDAPHVYIFTLVTALIYLTHRWHCSPKPITAAGIGLLIGLISICRASGFLTVLIPLLWGIDDFSSFKEKIRLLIRNYRHVLILIAAAAVAVLPQILYWKVNTGEFIYNAYDDPQSGFDFRNPRFIYVLFGFRKGFYLYSTMMIFATIGLIQLFKYNRKILLAILLFFLANVYLIACYSSLVSYGWRAFIEVHAILAIPLGYFVFSVVKNGRMLKYAVLFLLFLFTVLNLFKTYQNAMGVIDGSRMTKEYYLATFFKIRTTPADRELLLVDRSEESKEYFSAEDKYQKKNLAVMDYEDLNGKNQNNLEDSIIYQGKFSFKLDSVNIWSPALRMPYKDITSKDHAWIKASVYIYPTDMDDLNKVLLVADFKHKDKIYKYRAFKFQDFNIDAKPGQWNRLSFDYLTPEVRTTDDILEVYIWYRGKSPCYVDDLTVDAFEKK
jgi:hypothetical protein